MFIKTEAMNKHKAIRIYLRSGVPLSGFTFFFDWNISLVYFLQHVLYELIGENEHFDKLNCRSSEDDKLQKLHQVVNKNTPICILPASPPSPPPSLQSHQLSVSLFIFQQS